jgi:RNA polymerase sigma-70 factor, ECF subfamily
MTPSEPRVVSDRSPPAELPDGDVVERVRRGETALFEVLMRRHNRRLFRTVWSVLRNEADAEDILQEAYVAAYRHLDQYRADASFPTWMTRIALNAAFLRKRQRKQAATRQREQQQEEDAVQNDLEREDSPEEAASRREYRALLQESVAAMPEMYRTVFVLRAVEDLSTAETAECLGLTEEAVKVRLFRARALLREKLEGQVDDTAREMLAFAGERCDRIVSAVMRRIGEP